VRGSALIRAVRQAARRLQVIIVSRLSLPEGKSVWHQRPPTFAVVVTIGRVWWWRAMWRRGWGACNAGKGGWDSPAGQAYAAKVLRHATM
jgi:hypothetical protein